MRVVPEIFYLRPVLTSLAPASSRTFAFFYLMIKFTSYTVLCIFNRLNWVCQDADVLCSVHLFRLRLLQVLFALVIVILNVIVIVIIIVNRLEL